MPAPQDQTPHPWRSASDLPPDPPSAADPNAPNQAPPPPNYSSYPSFPNAPQAGQLPNPNTPMPGMNGQQQRPYAGQQPYAPPPQQPVPARLTLPQGTYISVRISQPLSSDHNQTGDTFFATLAEPIVVNGVVVAQRGETVTGRVTDAEKAGRVQGVSHLGLELTTIKLVDGQQLQVQSQMLNRNGDTSVGRDAAGIGTTAAVGAAVGAGVAGGVGAGAGAGAGAALGIIGVLLTRGRPTVVYPETPLTFRITAPVEIATDHAPQAFHYVQNRDYGSTGYAQRPPAPGYAAAPGYPVAPAPYYGPAYYPYPYYWGPGVSVFVGPGFYGRYRGWR